MVGISPDRDSLAALDALLRIRESAASRPNQSSGQQGLSWDASATSSPSASTAVVAPPQTSLSDLAATLRCLLPMNAANLWMQNQHRASVAATNQAHAHLAAVQAATANSWNNALLASQVSTPPIENSIPGNNDSSAANGKPNKANTSFLSSDLHQKPPLTEEDGDLARAAAEAIRKEKVEQALRSKPQRGRKRDDLSDKERLELTRTRNREHAKSTRIRKKARNQELLDREEMYLKMQEEDDLQTARRNCLQDFFVMRQEMLMEQVQRDSRSQKSVENTSAAETSQARDFKNIDRLSNLVTSSQPFQFQAHIPGRPYADSEDALHRMNKWDAALVEGLIRVCTVESLRSSLFEYTIESGSDGIALNKSGGAFCRVELLLRNRINTSDESQENANIIIVSGICSAKFSPKSARLISLDWTTLKDQCTGFSLGQEFCDSESSQSSRETLGSQLVHPSVVSLDHIRHADTEDCNHGPGMDI